MSVPQAIFIDTCILKAQKFSFGTRAMLEFRAAVSNMEVTLLLPAPIEQEIRRHIAAQARKAIVDLKRTIREAPFLLKCKEWSIDVDSPFFSYTLQGIAEKEWRAFLGRFEVECLGYEGLPLQEIMSWYETARAPFGAGKKRKEFPDAFAIAMLVRYSQMSQRPVAVISHDPDMKGACDCHTELMHFSSLASYTEGCLSSDSRMERARALLAAGHSSLEDAIKLAVEELAFDIDSPPVDSLVVQCTAIDLERANVTSFGEADFTVSFAACVYVSADFQIEEGDPEVGYFTREGSADDEFHVSGTVKVALCPEEETEGEVIQVSIESPADGVLLNAVGADEWDGRYEYFDDWG